MPHFTRGSTWLTTTSVLNILKTSVCSDTEKFALSPNSSGTLKPWFTSQEFPQMLQAGNPTSKEKKAVLRYTFAGNYAVQGTRTADSFYNDKPSLHKTNLSQIAKVSFNKNPANPPTKKPTNKTNTGRAKVVS